MKVTNPPENPDPNGGKGGGDDQAKEKPTDIITKKVQFEKDIDKRKVKGKMHFV